MSSIQQGTIEIEGVSYKWSPVLEKADEGTICSSLFQNNSRQVEMIFREKVDYNPFTSWYSASPFKPAEPQWVGYDFKKTITKIGVALIFDNYGSHKPLDYQVQYYANGEWIDAVNVVGATGLIGKTKLYMFDKPITAEKFRYQVTKNTNTYAAVLHRLRLLDEKEFVEEYEHEILEKFQTEDGIAVKQDNTVLVSGNGNYNSVAPAVIGYEYVGYKIDGGVLQSATSAAINNINENHVVIFVYKKKEIIGNCLVLSGMVMYFAASNTPDGWLVCDGSEVSINQYSDLFGVIGYVYGEDCEKGNFRLPDLRGEFIRGYDYGRGVDVNRVFGDNQLDALQDHTHGSVVATATTMNASNNPLSVARVADETRPRNVSLLPCIKY